MQVELTALGDGESVVERLGDVLEKFDGSRARYEREIRQVLDELSVKHGRCAYLAHQFTRDCIVRVEIVRILSRDERHLLGFGELDNFLYAGIVTLDVRMVRNLRKTIVAEEFRSEERRVGKECR